MFRHMILIWNLCHLKKDWQQALIGLSGRGEVFDIVYLDPPYQMAEAVNKQAIEMMRDSGLLSPTAIVIAEQTINPEPVDGFTLKFINMVENSRYI